MFNATNGFMSNNFGGITTSNYYNNTARVILDKYPQSNFTTKYDSFI